METVLVADHEQLVADTLVMVLDAAGYSANAAYSLEDVLEATSASCPDLAIMDSYFGKTSAVDVALELRRRGCAVVLMSGESDTVSTRWYKDCAVVPKPISPAELLGEVRRILDRRAVAYERKRAA